MRPAPRIKFIWGAGNVIRGRWYLGLFGFYERLHGMPDSGLAISTRGLLAWLHVLAFLGYVAAATTLFWIWQRNPYTELTYQDALLYPLRRAQITEKKGRAFNAQGIDLFKSGKYFDAANLLKHGLARYPHDFEARRTLAQFYLLANQRPFAVRVLQEGLTDSYPGRPYLETLFSAAEQAEDYDLVIAVTARYVAEVERSGSAADQRWLRDRRFAALSAANRHAEALALVEAAARNPGTAELRVFALLALNRVDEALQALDAWRKQAGADPKIVLRLQVRAYREAKQFEPMERALEEMRTLTPADPAPLVYGVVQRAMAGQVEAANAAFDDYLFRFGGDPGNLKLAAEPLAEIGELELVERCHAASQERGYALPLFARLVIQCLVHRGEWGRAERALTGLPEETGREAAMSKLWIEWTNRLIEAAKAPSDAAQLALVDFLRSRPWPAGMFRRTVETLRRADRLDAARDVLAVATRAFPASAWFQAEAATVGAAIAARTAPAEPRTFVAANAAARQFLEKVYFQKLDELVAAKSWSGVVEQIEAARAATPTPAWLDARAPAMRLLEMRSRHAMGDRDGMVIAARLYLNGAPARSAEIVKAAVELRTAGDKDAAITLTKEALRRTPTFKPAVDLMAELQPPPPIAPAKDAKGETTTAIGAAGK